jgi:YesN/AraC family two-component response regulator
VKTAKNGREALKSIQTEPPPKLVILDVKMPEMNGIETLKWIRENRPEINVIMLSAAGQHEIVEESLGLGAKGFITKPMNLKLLLSKVNTILGKS